MKIEHSMAVIPVDEKLAQEVEKFKSEGWMPMPGVTPIAVYHLIKVNFEEADPLAALGAIAKLTIDESKVDVLRKNPETGELEKVG